jgi:hypothetical protein
LVFGQGGLLGYLIYGAGTEYAIEDRLLAHLKMTIAAKLRLQESFLLSWKIPVESGSGRIELWMSPSIPVQFRFSESQPPELNRAWLEALALSSHSARGMRVMSEGEASRFLAKSPLRTEESRPAEQASGVEQESRAQRESRAEQASGAEQASVD